MINNRACSLGMYKIPRESKDKWSKDAVELQDSISL